MAEKKIDIPRDPLQVQLNTMTDEQIKSYIFNCQNEIAKFKECLGVARDILKRRRSTTVYPIPAR